MADAVVWTTAMELVDKLELELSYGNGALPPAGRGPEIKPFCVDQVTAK